jgi:nicotinamidase-related amidase
MPASRGNRRSSASLLPLISLHLFILFRLFTAAVGTIGLRFGRSPLESYVKSALLIIDVQIGLVRLMPAEVQDCVLSNIGLLLGRARSSGMPVVFIQHDGGKGHPIEAETPAWEIHPAILPRSGEAVIRKKASDSFFETGLGEELRRRDITHLVIAGAMTEYCVDTTCRRAVTLGYDVTLVADAHLTRDAGGLTASQIIAHHNLLLDGFGAGGHAIKVSATDEVLV